ncbi:MAG: hypothetical protein PHD76_05110 [Methylacidiphilales bacterium]|nr:hypothetical protein [Candidatus Methylacidiphilales bacterium]
MGLGFVFVFWLIIAAACLFILLTFTGFFILGWFKKWTWLKWLAGLPAASLLMLVLPFAAFALLCIGHIFWDFYGLYLSHKPETEDITGKYVLCKTSELSLRQRKYSRIPESEIIIYPSRLIELKNVPDCVFNGTGESNNGFLSGSGTWEIKKSFPGYSLSCNINDGTIKHGGYGGLSLQKWWSEYLLNFTIGDPDNDETLSYKKQK